MTLAIPFPLRTDSYKLTHWRQYPPGTTEVYGYLESRGGAFPHTVFFGLQYYLRAYLAGAVVSRADVEYARHFAADHFGRDGIFNHQGWLHIVEQHGGRLPVEIRAVAEGSVVPTHNVLMTIANTCAECFWLTNFIESLLLKVWYPTTVATLSYAVKMLFRQQLVHSGEDPSLADTMLHDFGYRGVSSEESAAIGGAAHLVNFRTSDTLAANLLLRAHYTEADGDPEAWMPASSVVASEHSTMTAWGREHEVDAYRNMLEQYPSGIVSIVIDSYDTFHAVRDLFGTALKPLVLAHDGILVLRPDSGDPAEVLGKILSLLAERFGVIRNDKDYKLLPPQLRLLWGDGVNLPSARSILEHLTGSGWSAANLILGMGGGVLQKLDRDTLRFAFKCSSIKVNGEQRDVWKEPVTDPGKVSKCGKLALLRDAEGYRTVRKESAEIPGDLLQPVFRDGEVLRHESLSEIRQRAGTPDLL